MPTMLVVRPDSGFTNSLSLGIGLSCLLASSPLLAADPAPAGGPPAGLPVTVQVATPVNVPIQIEAVGQTEGAREVEVRARVGGIIEKRLYQEGDAVKAGQVLFQLDPVPFEIALAQSEAQRSEKQAAVNQATREQVRFKELFRQKAISQKESDDASSQLELAKAALALADAQLRQAKLNLSYTRVTAPVSGVSGRAEHSEGSLVNASSDSLLTRIVQLNPIWVRFSLSDNELAKIPSKQLTAESVSQVRLQLASGDFYAQNGKLNFAASALDPQLSSLSLRAEFANPGSSLLPGQFVRVNLTVGEQKNVFLLPQSAVMQGEHGHFVWVAQESKAAYTPVKVGAWSGSNWIIESGLKEGDQVILDNLLKVRPGAPVSPAPAQAPAAKPAH